VLQKKLASISPVGRRLCWSVGVTLLASPADFLPIPSGWEERSSFIRRIGRLSFFHFDFYAQALSKVERGHHQDIGDVHEMVARGLVNRAAALEYFARLEPYLHRFPAVDASSLRRAVQQTFGPLA
jgi:hypothetical protein